MTFKLDPHQLKEVVERAKTDDADAWELLYRHSYHRLISYAQRRLHDTHRAEEAVCEAMVRAVHGLRDFAWQRSGFDGWMYGILRNVILERLREPQRDARLTERYGSDPTTRSIGTVLNPQDYLDSLINQDSLRNAFLRLPEADQEILELRIVGELSAAEVGSVLGKSAQAVRMAQSRALARLRTIMKEVDGDQ